MFKQLLYSSPKYSGNIKLSYNIDTNELKIGFIENINPIFDNISNSFYLHDSGNFSNDSSNLSKNIKSEIYKLPIVDNQPTYIKDNQFNLQYYTKCKLHNTDQFNIFSPIYMKATPRFYAIYAFSSSELKKMNNFGNILEYSNNLLKVIDLRETKLGAYLSNTLSNFDTSKDPININTNSNTIDITGHDLLNGNSTTKTISHDITIKKSVLDEQIYINDLYKSNSMLHPYMYNIEFIGKNTYSEDKHMIGVYLDHDKVVTPTVVYKESSVHYKYNETQLILPSLNTINSDFINVSDFLGIDKLYKYKHLDHTIFQFCKFKINGAFDSNDYINIGKNDNKHVIYPSNYLVANTATHNIFSNKGSISDISNAIIKAINNLNIDVLAIYENETILVESTIVRYRDKLKSISSNNKLHNPNLVFDTNNNFIGGVTQSHSNYVIVDTNITPYLNGIVNINNAYYQVIETFIYHDELVLKLDRSVVSTNKYLHLPKFTQAFGYKYITPKLYELNTKFAVNDVRFQSYNEYNFEIGSNDKSTFLSLLKLYNNDIGVLIYDNSYTYIDVIAFINDIEYFNTLKNSLLTNYQYELDNKCMGFKASDVYGVNTDVVQNDEIYVKHNVLFNYPFKENIIYNSINNNIPNVNIVDRNYEHKNLEYFLLQQENTLNFCDNYILEGFNIDKYLEDKFDYFTYYFSDSRGIVNNSYINTNVVKYNVIGTNNIVDYLGVQYTFKNDLMGYKFAIISNVNNITTKPYKIPVNVIKNDKYKNVLVILNINTFVDYLDIFKLYNLNDYENEYNLPFSFKLNSNTNIYSTTTNANGNNFNILDYLENGDDLHGYKNGVLFCTLNNILVVSGTKISCTNITLHGNAQIDYNSNFYTQFMFKTTRIDCYKKQIKPFILKNIKTDLETNGIFVLSPNDFIQTQNYQIVNDNDMSVQTTTGKSHIGYIQDNTDTTTNLYKSNYNTSISLSFVEVNQLLLYKKRFIDTHSFKSINNGFGAIYPIIDEFVWDTYTKSLFDTPKHIMYPNNEGVEYTDSDFIFNSIVEYLPPQMVFNANDFIYDLNKAISTKVSKKYLSYYYVNVINSYYVYDLDELEIVTNLDDSTIWQPIDLDYNIVNGIITINNLMYKTGKLYIQIILKKYVY